MKGFLPLILGVFGTFAFSWFGLIVVPNSQIGHLDPQTDEDGNDPYPAPKSGMAERGREVYAANGCIYCHSQQVRADYAASDIERKWGDRRSAPRDYIFDRPALLGKMRLGPDLANIGKRAPSADENAPPPDATAVTAATPAASVAPANPAPIAPAAEAAPPAAKVPAASASTAVAATTTGATKAAASNAPAAASPSANSAASPAVSAQTAEVASIGKNGEPLPYSAAWHHRHLYAPRSVSPDSIMPAYRFLYEKRRVGGERAADAISLSGENAPASGWEIVPTYDAKCLVAYLMSLDQSHPLKEVKSTAPASPPAPGKAVK